MTNHINIKNLIQFSIIFLFGIYSAILYFQDKLIFYIHPRYIWLSAAGAGVTIIIGIFGILKSFETDKVHSSHTTFRYWLKESGLQDAIILIVLFCGLLIQPRQLSSATAIQRSTDTTIQRTNTNIPTQNELFFSFDYTKLGILDWANLMRINPNVDSYKDKPAHIVGFVYQDTQHPEGYYFIARFKITCCAVDATPIKLLVKGRLPENTKANDWIDLQGHFDIDIIKGEKVSVIVPEHVITVSQPATPYVY